MEWLFEVPEVWLAVGVLVVSLVLAAIGSAILETIEKWRFGICPVSRNLRSWERITEDLYKCGRCSFVGSYPQRHQRDAAWPPGIRDRIPEDVSLPERPTTRPER